MLNARLANFKKKELDLEALESILAIIRSPNNDSELIGSYFASNNVNIQKKEYDELIQFLLDTHEIPARLYDIISEIIAQVAATDFADFVDNQIPKLLKQTEKEWKEINVRVFKIILDPHTGFLLNAPSSPKNNTWKPETTHYDFFSIDSEDHKHPFGQKLYQFRLIVYGLIRETYIEYIDTVPNNTEYVFVSQSIINNIHSMIVLPEYRARDLLCGFPGSIETMLAISSFQNQEIYELDEKDQQPDEKMVDQWTEFTKNLTGFETRLFTETYPYATPKQVPNTNEIRLFKLLPFTNVQMLKVKFLDKSLIIDSILNKDPSFACFIIELIQTMFFLSEDYVFDYYDNLIKTTNKFHELTALQIYVFYMTLSRFIDVLRYLPQRFLDQNQSDFIDSYGMIGISFPNPQIRVQAYKVLSVIGKSESSDGTNVYHLFKNNRSKFEQYLLALHEAGPLALTQTSDVPILLPLPFKDGLRCNNPLLWQYYLVAFSQESLNFPKNKSKVFIENALKFVKLNKDLPHRKLAVIHLLTYLASLAEFPILRFGQRDEVGETPSIIVDLLLDVINDQFNERYAALRTMLVPLHFSASPVIVMRANQQNNINLSILILRSISWNINFQAISENQEYFSIFYKSFLSIGHQFTPDATDLMKREIMAIAIKIFQFLAYKYKDNYCAPFPCVDFVTNQQAEELKEISTIFPIAYAITTQTSKSQRYKLFAQQNLCTYFSCSGVYDINLLCSDDFFIKLREQSIASPDIYMNLLCHHFEILFPRYIQFALEPGGEYFFIAISLFFRASSLDLKSLPYDILRNQWLSCNDSYRKSLSFQNLQVIYESCGTFIYMCFLYMNLTDLNTSEDAFILLGSLTPVLNLFHMKGRPDDLTDLFALFLDICKIYGHTISCLDFQATLKISTTLCTKFMYCVEQLMNDAFDSLSKFQPNVIDNMIYVLMPWFHAIEFNIENRVISKETETLFLRFNCSSFIDKLISSFKHTEHDDVNSALFNLWRALVSEDGQVGVNFIPCILSLQYSASILANQDNLTIIMKYLFQISSNEVVSIVSHFLTMNALFFNYYNNPYNSQNMGKELLTELGITDDEQQLPSALNVSHFSFITLKKLAQLSIRPVIQCLPIIFSSCLVLADTYFHEIQDLLLTIGNALRTLVEGKSSQCLQDMMRLFQKLPSKANLTKSDLVEISTAFTQFLLAFDQHLATEYGQELLKWALCYGDLKTACYALTCYQGNLLHKSNLIIGLVSRAMWNISDIMITCKTDKSNYIEYLTCSYQTLRSLANKMQIFQDSSLLWIAIEGMKFNTAEYAPIFDSALHLLEFFGERPTLFDFLMKRSSFQYGMFTDTVFWKFHHPWDDVFEGCLEYIFLSDSNNTSLKIHVINQLVQLQFPDLISSDPQWPNLVLIALIPWIWSVLMKDISRYLYDTIDVQTMEYTYECILPYINNVEVQENLTLLFQHEENDTFTAVSKICELIIPSFNEHQLHILIKFFITTLSNKGTQFMIIPLYSVATHILTHAQNPSFALSELAEFTEIVLNDTKLIRKPYVSLYKSALPEMPKKQDSFELPRKLELTIFERVVAVNIPHLYEMTSSEDTIIDFNELNSLPPLLPFETEFDPNSRFVGIYQLLKAYRCEPFATYNEIINKLHSSIVDVEELDVTKLCDRIESFPIHKIFYEYLTITEYQSQELEILDETEETQENQNPQDDNIVDYTDPYSFLLLKAEAFIPTVDDVNIIGNELFESDAPLY